MILENLPVAGVKNSAAGLYVHEDDRSAPTTTAKPLKTVGVLVGPTVKGTTEPRFYSKAEQWLAEYGNVPVEGSFAFYAALIFLQESDALWFTRVTEQARYAGVTVSNVNGVATIDSADIRWGGNPLTEQYGTTAQKTANGGDFDSELFGKGQLNPLTFEFTSSDLFIIYDLSAGVRNLSFDLIPAGSDTIADHAFHLVVYEDSVQVETFLVSLTNYIYGGKQCEIESRVNSNSKYIRVLQNQNAAVFVDDETTPFVTTSIFGAPALGGDSGLNPGTDKILEALNYYSNQEAVRINVLINNGYTDSAIQSRLLEMAETRMDCMSIIDVPSSEQLPENAVKFRNRTLRMNTGLGEAKANTSYSALYSCDILVHDKINDRRVMVPISSAVAAAYAASDRNFAEWFAPAGKKRGLLSGDKKYISVIGVRHDYGKTDRDLLDANQVNPVRVIAGNGIYLWGISTLQRETSARQFVSVRRLLLRIETLLQDRIMFNVFDPNDEILRNAIIALCDRELQAIKDGRGLYAFVVVCDDSNNTVEDVINGDLNINLYLDAVLPAKRIIVNLVINRTGVRSTVL